jgi:hypothetical protein
MPASSFPLQLAPHAGLQAHAAAPPAMRFTADEAQVAFDDWGFNCGPGALCGVLELRPEQVRPHLPGFEEKRYTNPTMLQAALRSLGVSSTTQGHAQGLAKPIWPKLGFARIQWGGRWMKPGVPMAARYWHTHWVGSWVSPGGTLAVFDVNAVESGGWLNLHVWEGEIVPYLTSATKGSDGTWLMTHSIEVQRG